MSAASSTEAWKILQNSYKGSGKVITIKLQTLWKDFENLLMMEDETIEAFFNLAAIEESKDLKELSITELISSLQAHEERMKRFSEQPLEQAFQAKLKFNNGQNKNHHGKKFQQRKNNSNNRGRGRNLYHNQGSRENNQSGPYCNLCKKIGHNTNDCRYKCKRCQRHTHFEKDCWFRQKDEANFIETNESTGQLFYSCLNTQQENIDIWYLDSGCSNHMTGNKNSFVSLNENIKSQITLGDGRSQDVAGKGTIAKWLLVSLR
ncbi:hypothetical protein RND81_08G063500 [Saponaria officinalis]|uniref:Retrovirus-related Pol polyprotein from transposon TNT 1-94-like beta-barrel domain-containing protein n=1 Tax=Saponaria officinalis TaxID=3572 RepID=A0AAW1J405_SAPOF